MAKADDGTSPFPPLGWRAIELSSGWNHIIEFWIEKAVMLELMKTEMTVDYRRGALHASVSWGLGDGLGVEIIVLPRSTDGFGSSLNCGGGRSAHGRLPVLKPPKQLTGNAEERPLAVASENRSNRI